MALVRLPAQASLAVAPGSVKLPWHSTVSGLFPVRVMVGATLSLNVTAAVQVEALPWPSFTVSVSVAL